MPTSPAAGSMLAAVKEGGHTLLARHEGETAVHVKFDDQTCGGGTVK